MIRIPAPTPPRGWCREFYIIIIIKLTSSQLSLRLWSISAHRRCRLSQYRRLITVGISRRIISHRSGIRRSLHRPPHDSVHLLTGSNYGRLRFCLVSRTNSVSDNHCLVQNRVSSNTTVTTEAKSVTPGVGDCYKLNSFWRSANDWLVECCFTSIETVGLTIGD